VEPVEVVHDLVHGVHENGVLAPALDVLGEELVWVADFGLNARLHDLDVALYPLFVDAVKVLADVVLVRQLDDAVVRLHVLFWLHHQFLCGEVL